ncbi:MAG: DUF790 family protein [Bradymonadaceae bacterium]
MRTRTKKGRVHPTYLDIDSPAAQERADELIAIFRGHLGSRRAEVDEAVERAVGYGTDFLIWRGLAKLLYDRSQFAVDSTSDPVDIRRAVFELAAESDGGHDEHSRSRILGEAAELLGLTAEDCERGLYADLEARQVLVEFKALTAVELLDRYNLALAQAVLYRATTLTITLDDEDSNRLRYLFQAIKFHRLMHTLRRVPDSNGGGGYELILDGPSSLFSKNRKYGLQMAKFLPALVHAGNWRLVADLDVGKGGKGTKERFELGSDEGLASHYKIRGQWVSKEEKWFEERFEKLDTEWTLERRGTAIELDDNEVIIADYVVRGPGGEEVFVEIVGFWRLAYLQRRIEMLVHSHETPLVIVVSERLKSGREKLENAPPEVIFFKGVILADKVLAAAQRAAGHIPSA